MFRIIKKSLMTGVVTGQYPKAEASEGPIDPEAVGKTKPFRRSLAISRSGYRLLQCLRDGDERAGESRL